MTDNEPHPYACRQPWSQSARLEPAWRQRRHLPGWWRPCPASLVATETGRRSLAMPQAPRGPADAVDVHCPDWAQSRARLDRSDETKTRRNTCTGRQTNNLTYKSFEWNLEKTFKKKNEMWMGFSTNIIKNENVTGKWLFSQPSCGLRKNLCTNNL